MPPKKDNKKEVKQETKEQTKTPQKTKVETKAAATPSKATKQTPKKEEVKKEAPKPATPKKPKEPVKVTKLARDKTATLPIDVTFNGDIAEAKQVKANYTHALKLDASAPFTLVDSYLIPEGQQNEGHQVILLKPAQAFKFMKLTPAIRQRIYLFYFLAKGQGLVHISLDGKRKNDTKDAYAKSFSEGSKNRVGLLAVNKEINEEAAPILYGRPLRFDSPGTLMTFFAGLDSRHRICLRHVEIRQYNKKDGKTALAFLAEAKALEHLRIEEGMAMDDDPHRVAKSVWLDFCKLFDAVGSNKEKMMVIDEPKQQVSKTKDNDESSDEEDDDDDDAEDSDEDEDEDEEEADEDETEETNDAQAKDSKDSASDVAQSDDSKDSNIVAQPNVSNNTNSEVTGDANIEATSTTEDTKTALTDTEAVDDTKAVVKTGGAMEIEDDSKTAATVKNDSKSPAPLPVKKVATPKATPKMRQGRKSDALDILHFGKAAFKYKDENKKEHNWDSSMKDEFMDALRAKLK